MLAVTALIAYLMTFGSGMLAYFTADATFPSLISADAYILDEASAKAPSPFFTIEIAPLMNVMTALVLAFVLGLGVAFLNGRDSLRNGLEDFRLVIELVIRRVIIPLLPLYILGIFVSMTVSGQVASVLSTFIKIILVIFALHIGLLVLQYLSLIHI